jgi:hypothetical protein
MRQHEVVRLIEAWIQEHSPFAAEVGRVVPTEYGKWLVQVECAELIWEQTVSNDGEVSAPLIID